MESIRDVMICCWASNDFGGMVNMWITSFLCLVFDGVSLVC